MAVVHPHRWGVPAADDRPGPRALRHPPARLLLAAACLEPAGRCPPVDGPGAQPAPARADRRGAVAAGAPPREIGAGRMGGRWHLGDAARRGRDRRVEPTVQPRRPAEHRAGCRVSPHPASDVGARADPAGSADRSGVADLVPVRRGGRRPWSGLTGRPAPAGAPPCRPRSDRRVRGRWTGVPGRPAVVA